MHGTRWKPHALNSFLNGNPAAQGLDVSPYEDVIPSPGSTSRPLALELATGQKSPDCNLPATVPIKVFVGVLMEPRGAPLVVMSVVEFM